MNGRLDTANRLALSAFVALVAVVLVACGQSYFEIPIQTPIKPKIDVSGFQRVLVAGFVAGGGSDVDANVETVRLLRSQLRLKSHLKVIDADAMPLAVVAREQGQVSSPSPDPNGNTAGSPATPDGTADGGSTASPPPASPNGQSPADPQAPAAAANGQAQPKPPTPLPTEIKDDKDLASYDRLFANTAYWKKIGEEYQSPLIVTGTVLFTPHDQSGFVQQEREVYDSFGRRQVVPVRTYMERKGYVLRPKFIFIDGRTGATLYSETFREEVLYDSSQETPALSSYFELMDRVMPSFLNTLASQKIRGTRVLLK